MDRILKIFAVKDQGAPNLVCIHWCIDRLDRQKIIHLTVAEQEDQLIIAELCALDFIVRKHKIFGGETVPKNCIVLVSHGAIKRLWKQDTEKTHLIPWARFLYPTIADGQLEVEKDAPWIISSIVNEEVRITATLPKRVTVRIPMWGIDVGLSRHAVERYMERREIKTLSKALSGIRKFLASSAARELAMSERRKFAKAIKHGKEAKYLINTDINMVFVIVPETDGWSLVTVLDEEVDGGFKQPVMVGSHIEYRYR